MISTEIDHSSIYKDIRKRGFALCHYGVIVALHEGPLTTEELSQKALFSNSRCKEAARQLSEVGIIDIIPAAKIRHGDQNTYKLNEQYIYRQRTHA